MPEARERATEILFQIWNETSFVGLLHARAGAHNLRPFIGICNRDGNLYPLVKIFP
jgi:hypothetical protein